MSSFLLNLARRAAGISIGDVQPPAPTPLAGAAAESEAAGALTELDAAPLDSPPVVEAAAAPPQEIPARPAIQRTPVGTDATPPGSRSPAPASPDRAREGGRAASAIRLGWNEPPAPPVEAPAPVLTVSEPIRPGREPDPGAGSIAADPDAPAHARRGPESTPRPAATMPADGRPTAVGPLAVRVDEAGSSPVVRPAASSPMPALPRPAPATPPLTAPPAPVHVRIGRIEVRGAPAPPPSAPARPRPAALGFTGYTRLRTYRSGSP